MEAIGVVVIAVLVVGVVVGLLIARNPPSWDELGGESPIGPLDAVAPSQVDDEADLRALVAEKRARRLAAGGAPVASDTYKDGQRAAGEPWAHLDAEVVEEARALVSRRRARLERTGKPVPDAQVELERLLGPPRT